MFNLQDDAVESEKILDGEVKLNDIDSDAINSSKIIDYSIIDEDISTEAAISFTKLDITQENIYSDLQPYQFNTGITHLDGQVSIGQDVATNADVQFNNIVVTNLTDDTQGIVSANYFVGNGAGIIGIDASNLSGAMSIDSAEVAEFLIVNTDSLVVSTNGYIGVGNTAPEVPMHLVGDGTIDGEVMRLQGYAIDDKAYISFFTSETNHRGSIGYLDSGDRFLGIQDSNKIELKVNDQAAVIVDEDGMGIGIENPTTRLEVNGTISANAFIGDGSNLTNLDPANMVNIPGSSIAEGTITSYNIKNESILSNDIQNGQILNEDISGLASIAFTKLNITSMNIRGNRGGTTNDLNTYRVGGSGLTLDINTGEFDIVQDINPTGSPTFEDLTINGIVSANLITGDGSLITNISASSLSGIESEQIATDTILAVDISSNAVTTVEIMQETIKNEDIDPEAQIMYDKLLITTADIREKLQPYSGGVGVTYDEFTGVFEIGQDVGVNTSPEFDGLIINSDALFVGGTGYVGIGTNDPERELEVHGEVSANMFIGDGSNLTNLNASEMMGITSLSIEDGTIGSVDINIGAIESAQILDETIVSLDIAEAAILAIHIKNDAILDEDIATGAVRSIEIEDETITSQDVLDDSIFGIDIKDETITSSDIAEGAIQSSEILNDTILNEDIAAGAVRSEEILNNTIKNEDIYFPGFNEDGIEFEKLYITTSDIRSLGSYADGTGVDYNEYTGVFSIGQDVYTTSSPTFSAITVSRMNLDGTAEIDEISVNKLFAETVTVSALEAGGIISTGDIYAESSKIKSLDLEVSSLASIASLNVGGIISTGDIIATASQIESSTLVVSDVATIRAMDVNHVRISDESGVGRLDVEGAVSTNVAVIQFANVENLDAAIATISTLEVLGNIYVSSNTEEDSVVFVNGTVSSNYFIGDGQYIRNISAQSLSGITSTQILDETILAEDIATGSVTTVEIDDETITSLDIQTSAVGTSEILDETILAEDIAEGAVQSEILNDTIVNEDINADAQIIYDKLLITTADIREKLQPYDVGMGMDYEPETGLFSIGQEVYNYSTPTFSAISVDTMRVNAEGQLPA